MKNIHWIKDGIEIKTAEEVFKEAEQHIPKMDQVAIVWLGKDNQVNGCWSMYNTTRAYLSEYLKKDLF